MSTANELETFFIELPNTARVNILRFISAFPHHRDWILHISSVALGDVAHEKHPLRDAALEAVTELFPHSSEDERTIRKIFETYGARCSSLPWNGELVHDFSRDRACSSLKKVQVLYSIGHVDDALLSLIFVQRNLEELKERDLGTSGVKGEVFNEIMQRGQKNYMKVVKFLTDLDGGLKRLEIPIFLAEGPSYSRMFDILGSTLESLKLSIRQDTAEDTVEPAPLTSTFDVWPPCVRK